MIKDSINKSRIKWELRRGMLELDQLFHRFYEELFDDCSVKEQEIFVRFLQEEDPTIWAWLFTEYNEEAPADYQDLLKKIKNLQHRT